ncbi:MAG: uracil-DNA glycosylase [Bacilli bacterium]
MIQLPSNIHPSWDGWLTEERKQQIEWIAEQVGTNVTPTDPEVILRFLTVDLHAVKVVWLGQDVYPERGVATGRSFEVGGLRDWHRPFRQVSMKNIVRLVHKTVNGIVRYEDIRSFRQILREMDEGQFVMPKPNEWFGQLEAQGVLFLNRSFTCEPGNPNSHEVYWREVSESLLTYIGQVNPNIHWFLWGKEAQRAKEWIVRGQFHSSRHPMMCSIKYDDDFLKFKGFALTSKDIVWNCEKT